MSDQPLAGVRKMCDFPGCTEAAGFGRDWAEKSLRPVQGWGGGLHIRIDVEDLDVTLRLCRSHAVALVDAALQPILASGAVAPRHRVARNE